MTRRYYANAAPQRTLNGSISSGSASIVVSGTFAGWPTSYPFHAVLEYGTANMEIVLVSGITGSTATVTRGQDGTAAVSHNSGATMDFGLVAKDADEANAHINASSGVHGLTGAVVGTSDTQTLTNKTLTAPAVSSPAFSGTASTGLALTGAGTAASYTANGNGAVSGVVVPKTYANAAARDAALTSPTAGTVVWLTAPGALVVYSGTAWQQIAQGDTGWVFTGATPLSSTTIGTQAMRRIGDIMVLKFSVTLGVAITVGASGDTTNTSLLQLPAQFTPSQFQGLHNDSIGPLVSYAVGTDGLVKLSATDDAASLGIGTSLSFSGTIFA